MPLFAWSIFLGAFLLFQVQPLLGRYVLPWYGGSPAVWMTCMLFFQTMLLAGYLYAHLLTSRLRLRRQVVVHLTLMAVALIFLPPAPNAEFWKPKGDASPVAGILLLLLCNIGLPGMLIAATSPLLQRWFADAFPGASPYRLYALSNVGSMLALLSYPFIFEPMLRLQSQSWLWSGAFVAYALVVAACGLGVSRRAAGEASASDAPLSTSTEPLPRGRALFWLLLSALGSAILLATSNQLCQEVMSVPFLWIAPLAVYLVTFIICFDRERWYHRGVAAVLLAVAAFLACRLLYGGVNLGLLDQIIGYNAVLFAVCFACHGELVRAKPVPRHLTFFYLVVSAGGVVGGLFVAVLAPAIFAGYYEYELSLVLAFGLILVAWMKDDTARSRIPRIVRLGAGPVWVALSLALAYLAGVWELQPALASQLGVPARFEFHDISTRNFYGVLKVTDRSSGEWAYRRLQYGRIVHGFQFLDPAKLDWPTAYYGPGTGIDTAINRYPARTDAATDNDALRVGVVGLGVGTLLAWGRPGDVYRYYEINPDVFRIADDYFSFTSRTKAAYERVLGDGRIQLERELREGGSQNFDILVVDAFSSDAIPLHLLTKECAQVYAAHLKPGGMLAFHLSNRYVDLLPVTRALGETLGMECVIMSTPHNERGSNDATWVVLTKNEAWLADPEVRSKRAIPSATAPKPILWTDDYAALWPVLRF